jgi:hypothetical protein
MSQIKFSQKTIAGLPEALEALLLQINAQGSAGSSALTAAINAEIAARTAADTTISNLLDVVNGDSTVNGSFRKAIADVIGSAPEALNTLKEIADYIAVNPEANVADAINAAIAAAQQAVADLAVTVGDLGTNKADIILLNQFLMRLKTSRTEDVTLSALNANGAAGGFTLPEGVNIGDISNFGNALFVHPSTNVSYLVPVFFDGTGFSLNFSGLESEVTDALAGGTATAKIQYEAYDFNHNLESYWGYLA